MTICTATYQPDREFDSSVHGASPPLQDAPCTELSNSRAGWYVAVQMVNLKDLLLYHKIKATFNTLKWDKSYSFKFSCLGFAQMKMHATKRDAFEVKLSLFPVSNVSKVSIEKSRESRPAEVSRLSRVSSLVASPNYQLPFYHFSAFNSRTVNAR